MANETRPCHTQRQGDPTLGETTLESIRNQFVFCVRCYPVLKDTFLSDFLPVNEAELKEETNNFSESSFIHHLGSVSSEYTR